MTVGNLIFMDDIDTWPDDFRNMALDAKQLVIDFQTVRHEFLLRRMEGDLAADFAFNPHRRPYNALLERLEPLLAPHRLVVYHCTRLTPREAENIRTNGIQLLSAELVHRRLDDALADGHIDATDHGALKGDPGSVRRIEKTKGAWWGCAVRSTLKDTGVSYFFRTWGGEGIYFHLTSQQILPRLRMVGVPYIVVAAVPHAYFPEVGRPVAERFMAQLVIDDVESVEPPPGFDFRTQTALDAGNVIELVDYHDPRFKQWTHWHRWTADERPKVPPRSRPHGK
jgi:hypothetical protein